MIECIVIMTQSLLLQVVGMVQSTIETGSLSGGLAGSYVDMCGPRVSATPGIGILTTKPEMNRKIAQSRCRRYTSKQKLLCIYNT